MEISLTQEAKQYIIEKGGTVSILSYTAGGCCGGALPIIETEFEEPKSLEGYIKKSVGDIAVFVDKRIGLAKQIDISVVKLIWLKKLDVKLVW